MAKRPPPGICTYCLKHSDNRTWDHILPLSWYPTTTPKDMEKWKVPVCKSCNQRLGRIEKELLKRLGLCLDPRDLASLGVSKRAIRSISPSRAKNDRDRAARSHERDKLLNEVIHLHEAPTEGIFPGFGAQPIVRYDEYHVIQIPEEMVEAYAEKLVRGMAYVIDEEPIPEGAVVELYVVRENSDSEFLALIEDSVVGYHRGFGIQVIRSVREDGKAWIYGFLIWRRFKFYGVVHFGDLEEL